MADAVVAESSRPDRPARRRGVALAIAVVALGAACSNSTTPKGTTERDDVITAANAVCRQDVSTKKVDQAAYKAQFGTKDPTEAAARDFLINTVAPHLDSTVAALHSIPEPLKDKEKWLAGLEAIDRDNHDFKYSIDQEPIAAAKRFAAADPTAARDTGKLFVDFGAKDCATL